MRVDKVFKVLLVMALSTSFISCRYIQDCYRSSYSKNGIGYDYKVSKAYIYNLIDAINEKSPEKFEKLISGSKGVVCSSEEIDEIINLFSGKILDPHYRGHGYTDQGVDYGKYEGSVVDHLVLQSDDGRYYHITYDLIYIDDYYDSNEGFTYLRILDDLSAAEAEFTGEWPKSESSSFFVDKGKMHDGFSEVRNLIVDLLFYRDVERSKPVTLDSVEKFLNSNIGYSDFVSYFGEPNMICHDYYTVWETDDGKYIRIFVDERNDVVYDADLCSNSALISKIDIKILED